MAAGGPRQPRSTRPIGVAAVKGSVDPRVPASGPDFAASGRIGVGVLRRRTSRPPTARARAEGASSSTVGKDWKNASNRPRTVMGRESSCTGPLQPVSTGRRAPAWRSGGTVLFLFSFLFSFERPATRSYCSSFRSFPARAPCRPLPVGGWTRLLRAAGLVPGASAVRTRAPPARADAARVGLVVDARGGRSAGRSAAPARRGTKKMGPWAAPADSVTFSCGSPGGIDKTGAYRHLQRALGRPCRRRAQPPRGAVVAVGPDPGAATPPSHPPGRARTARASSRSRGAARSFSFVFFERGEGAGDHGTRVAGYERSTAEIRNRIHNVHA